MSEDEQELAKQCLQLHFTASAGATLLTERNILSLRYSSDQLAYLSRVHRDAVFGLTSNASTADRLISTFAKRKDVSWMMVTFDPREGILLQSTATERKQILKVQKDDKDYTRFQRLHTENKLSASQKLLLIFLHSKWSGLGFLVLLQALLAHFLG